MQTKKHIATALILLTLIGTVSTATCSSIEQFGITWTFDINYECGQFANGDYWVVGPVVINSIDPPSAYATVSDNIDNIGSGPFKSYPYPQVTSNATWSITNVYGSIRATILTENTQEMTSGMSLLVSDTTNPTINNKAFKVFKVVENTSFSIYLQQSNGSLDNWGNYTTTVGGTFGGRIINGSMINPTVSNGNKQGYDSYIGSYTPSLNVAWDVNSSNPLIVPVSSSLISTISTYPSAKQRLKTAAVLTVLSAVPPANSFRPPYLGTDKTIRYNSDTVMARINLLPKLAVPAGTTAPSLASVERMFERVWLLHQAGYGVTYLVPTENSPDYGRDICVNEGKGALALLLDYTDEQKLPLLKKYTQVGIDLYQYVLDDANNWWSPDGAILSGRKFPIIFAGYMLDDPGMLGIGSLGTTEFYFQEDAQTFYVAEENIGKYFTDPYSNPPLNHIYGFDGDQGEANDTNVYTSEEIGMPEWGIKHNTNHYGGTEGLAFDRVRWGANYRGVNGYSWPGIALAVNILGLREEWNHNAFFDYMDRYMDVTAPKGEYPINRSMDSFAEKMWDTYRADYGNIWTETPECVDLTTLTNYISEWKQGSFGMLSLMQKIEKWKTGENC